MKLGALSVEGITKRFGTTVVLDDLSLSIAAGGFFALLGASGSGKTTLLRLLAGFESPDAGRMLLDGADLAGVPPYERPVNLVFQSYALFPHMTVAANIGFGLRREGMAGEELRRRVGEMLALVRLDGLAERKPREISGGQAQRVALARALAKRPKLLLLDEPMAALDRGLREHTRGELKRLHRELGTTFVLVTHDQEEALALADRVALLDAGRLAQAGSPEDLYERPASLAVARFIGQLNLMEGRVVGAGDALTIEVPRLGAVRARPVASFPAVGAAVAIGLRPEKIDFGAGDNAHPAMVAEVTYLGGQSVYRLRLAEGVEIRASRPNRDGPAARAGERVTISWPSAAVLVFPT
ncbi:MAG: ABC transporter ATP-binding protein [Alphaproteobacteria bacterium]|nr:ABC transporter ATP-binding protein [Alphaproteobacteria bacterium]